MDNERVFISYSHDTSEHENKVLELSDRLRDDGIDTNIDQYQTAPPEGWQLWMEKEIRDSKFVLLVCTETYLKRVMKEDNGGGKGVMWESTIIYSYLYEAGVINEKFIPIMFGHENTKYIPIPLKPTNYYDVSTEEGYESLYRRLTDQPYTTKPVLGKKKILSKRERKTRTPKVEVSLAKLPSTSSDLFGREKELKQLDDAWENDDINILSLVAWGGVGKTALVNKWLSNLGEDFRGAERVYGWSFYSQGAAEGRQVSADQFIAAALEWFGDPDVTKGSPWDKGERLAELIKQQRTLLILDGLEPLQNPPPVETGKIKDPGLTSLLRELARQNPGLVVISTRLVVDDLKDFIGSTAQEIDLESLSNEAGAKYLEHLGVDGTNEERKVASHEFGGHALALTLLGRYLKVVHGGDIRKRGEIPHVMDEQKQGMHARRVMESYEVFLKGKPELDILRLMGLFDRPAEKGALDTLRKEPAINGLTDALQTLGDADWQFAVNNLRDLRLLAGQDPSASDELDCHPLLREHFGEHLKNLNPNAWREGNSRLYKYYKTSAKELPDTIGEMAPLYAAVLHGCQAELHYEVLTEVFDKRITRGKEHYVTHMLGDYGGCLASLSNYYDIAWKSTVGTLNQSDKGYIFSTTGECLRALGRLDEAMEPLQTALEIFTSLGDWNNAAINATNLSQVKLVSGSLDQALKIAHDGVDLSDHISKSFERITVRSQLGDTLHKMGLLKEAAAVFSKAEALQRRIQPEYYFLYSVFGFRYCDLLLSQGYTLKAFNRAKQMEKWDKENNDSLLGYALNNLIIGQSFILDIQTNEKIDFSTVLRYLQLAVDGLRKAGEQEFIASALLARSNFFRILGTLDFAQKDLDESFIIATRGGMGLYLADCHLEYGRLYLAQGDKDKAREHWEIAKESIEKMGYHRRDKEVQELEEQLS